MELINMQFTLEELEEIKKALNSLLAERIKYETFETNVKRLEDNEKLKELDYGLLDVIITAIEGRK